MKRQAVQSSNIHSVGYDAGDQLLEIEFHSGGIYEYYRVPPETYRSLLKADSKGKYFHRNVKSTYKYKRIR